MVTFDLDFRSPAKLYVLINKGTHTTSFRPLIVNYAKDATRKRMKSYHRLPWYHSQENLKIENLKHDSSNSKTGELHSGAFSQTQRLFFVNSKMAADPQDLSC